MKLFQVLKKIVSGEIASQVPPPVLADAYRAVDHVKAESKALQEERIKWAKLPVLLQNTSEGEKVIELKKNVWVDMFPGISIMYLGQAGVGGVPFSHALIKGNATVPPHTNSTHKQEVLVLSGFFYDLKSEMKVQCGKSISYDEESVRHWELNGLLYTTWVPFLQTELR